MTTETYQTPLNTRYSSREMQFNFRYLQVQGCESVFFTYSSGSSSSESFGFGGLERHIKKNIKIFFDFWITLYYFELLTRQSSSPEKKKKILKFEKFSFLRMFLTLSCKEDSLNTLIRIRFWQLIQYIRNGSLTDLQPWSNV